MAAERGDPSRRAVDPFVAGVSDGVAHGYQAVERVVSGLHQSLRIQARPALPSAQFTAQGTQIPPRQTTYGQPATLALVDDLAAIFAELLTRAGDAAQEISHAITTQQQAGASARQDCISRLLLSATPGKTASVQFDFWNTQAVALRPVGFAATDFIGDAGRIGNDVVRFDPPVIEFLRPGDGASVSVEVAVPEQAAAGLYRALVQAEPGNATVVLELTVSAPAQAASSASSEAPPR
jgi:uncharacterized membrane protein